MLNRLFTYLRDGYEEVFVDGEIVVCDNHGPLYQSSEVIGKYPVRSLLKPFQFLAAELPKDRWTKATKNNRYVPCLGSISATESQLHQLVDWYAGPKFEDLISKLHVSLSYPMDEAHRSALKAKGHTPKPIYHTCFSKHMGILEACEVHGWELGNYYSTSHPFYKNLVKTLSALLGEELNDLKTVTDGCTLPSPVLSVTQMAQLYQALACAPGDSNLGYIRKLMVENPDWIGGPGRVDTRLMQENAGQVVAKEGADGLLGISVFPTKQYPHGLGIVAKIGAGFIPAYAATALAPLLENLHLRSVHEIPRGQSVKYYYKPFEKIEAVFLDISPEISEETAVFPGDVGFKRTVSLDTQSEDHLTLSHMETTLHVGAHTDAPNHFEISHMGIDEVKLQYYAGPCQVIDVTTAKSQTLSSKDIQGKEINAPRVLFKTGSYPDPTKYNKDFVALSPELIRYLSVRKVILVGIDTPSIDLWDSKDLFTHLATREEGMMILEGITLNGISEGNYDLIALPLRIKDGDASPVRAVLKPLS